MNPTQSPVSAGFSRRRFLQTSSAAVAFATAPSGVLGAAGRPGANSRLNIASIGAGGRASDDLDGLKSENIVALCDVDWNSAAGSFERFPKATRHRDFRKMLETGKGVDAVLVAIPDHTHAAAAMAAIRHGKPVYCEKPLTRTVREARALTLAAREAGVATQMGNQGMEFEGNRLINEWLADGAIGPVREVHVWSDRPTHRGKLPLWWAQGVEAPTEEPPVPDYLDWDLWLGPAPGRAYHPAYAPFSWRGWWDFGSGGLGDMGIHNLAPVFAALELGAPTSVSASSTPLYPDSVPAACMVHYEFPSRGDQPPVRLHWYDGGLLPERPSELDEGAVLDPEDGILFVGDEGKMLVEGWGGRSPRLIPAARHAAYQQPPRTLPRSVGHYQEWINACKTGSVTRSNFDFAGPLTEAVLLGMVSVRMGGEKLLWDSAKLKIPNLPEAEKFLHYAYRSGWSL